MKRALRVLVSCVLAAGILGIGEYWKHPSPCSDCFAKYGFPFTAGHYGGFAGGGEVYWSGKLGNLTVLLALTIAITAVWERLATKHDGLKPKN